MGQTLVVAVPAVLFLACHFAEGAVVTVGQEDRIKAKPKIATHRPDQPPFNLAIKKHILAIGPCQA